MIRRPFVALSLAMSILTTLALTLLFTAPGLSADGGDDDTPNIPQRRELTYPNLGSHLDAVVAGYEEGRQSERQAARQGELHQGNSIAVTLHLDGNVADTVDFLNDNGASVRNVGEDYIEAYVPISLLGPASQQDGVTRIREIVRAEPMYGEVTSQGVKLHLAPAWHNNGYRGGGVKVGVIDIGFHGWQQLQGAELPRIAGAQCYTEPGVYSADPAACMDPNWGVHGAAVSEAVIDIAPEATLYISAPWSQGDLRNTVRWMVSEGVQVINMSLGWFFDGPGDGTSPYGNSPLRAVDDAVGGGIVWLNSAGNAARDTWYGDFNDSDNDTFHQWEGTDETQTMNLKAGDRIRVQLRWDDQWGGSAKDLDLFLTAGPDNSVIAFSADPQQGGANDVPHEWFAGTVRQAGEYSLLVKRQSGDAPDWLQLTVWWPGRQLEHYSENGSITNPAESANPGLLAVGATPYYDTGKIEWYSSRGPAPDGRIKPDITGVDCGASVTYTVYTRSYDNNQECWFSGTSQSSPHLAGLAALARQVNPSYTPQQTADYLKANAVERGDAGPDNTWGSGFAQLPAPPAATCHRQLAIPGGATGTWADTCLSQVASPDPDDAGDAKSYARYYTFTLSEAQEVAITLASNDDPKVDTYLYLRRGEDTRSGDVVAENDDLDRNTGSYDSGIVETLAAGSYTVEATTYYAATAGRFTLTIAGPDSGDGGTPAYACAKTFTADGKTYGTWDDTCLSQVASPNADDAGDAKSYARYYTFTLSEPKLVGITLESDDDPKVDTFLYLRQGEDTRSGPAVAENDDIDRDGGVYDSRIIRTLAAGSYTIEATTYKAATEGDFTLTFASLSVDAGTPTDCTLNQVLEPGDSCGGQDFVATVKSNGNLSLEFTGAAEGTIAPPDDLSFTRSGDNWTVTELPAS